MKQRTAEEPQAVRVEPCSISGCVEIVTVTNITAAEVEREDGQTATEYESDVYRLTYPDDGSDLQAYAEAHFDVFLELAKAEESAGAPTGSADKLAALMIKNADLQTTQDDILIIITDMIGGVE